MYFYEFHILDISDNNFENHKYTECVTEMEPYKYTENQPELKSKNVQPYVFSVRSIELKYFKLTFTSGYTGSRS